MFITPQTEFTQIVTQDNAGNKSIGEGKFRIVRLGGDLRDANVLVVVDDDTNTLAPWHTVVRLTK